IYQINEIYKKIDKYGKEKSIDVIISNLKPSTQDFLKENKKIIGPIVFYLEGPQNDADKNELRNQFNKIIEFKLSSELSVSLTPKISEKALRYDLTVPFARYVVMHQNEIDFPFKRYQ